METAIPRILAPELLRRRCIRPRSDRRRDLVWINVAKNPTVEWVARQIAEAFFGGAHLRWILRSSARYCNDIRTHRSLAKDAPVSRPVHRTGRIKSLPILGGLHHHSMPGFEFSVHTRAMRGRRRSRSWIIIERRAAMAKKLPPVHPGEILREEFLRP